MHTHYIKIYYHNIICVQNPQIAANNSINGDPEYILPTETLKITAFNGKSFLLKKTAKYKMCISRGRGICMRDKILSTC
jgi:hypothetical protein